MWLCLWNQSNHLQFSCSIHIQCIKSSNTLYRQWTKRVIWMPNHLHIHRIVFAEWASHHQHPNSQYTLTHSEKCKFLILRQKCSICWQVNMQDAITNGVLNGHREKLFFFFWGMCWFLIKYEHIFRIISRWMDSWKSMWNKCTTSAGLNRLD